MTDPLTDPAASPLSTEPVQLERERAVAAAVRDDGAPADIEPSRLDQDGVKILDRLLRHDHEAYFVGGCVRDTLLDRTPKDFDVCTSAHPGEIRSLFRNCRLIGRRFRLAHVYFRGGKIIEVSTFRANPVELEEGRAPPDDLLITQDNVFGTATEDARRRDFTVNGLFYDIRCGRVIDHVDGLADLRARLLRTIGDPEVRMREDPVRLLRAVRFASKLELEFDPATYAAMEGAVEDLDRCAPARLLDEVFKILRSGGSQRSFVLLEALGALPILLPPVAQFIRKAGPESMTQISRRLGALDRLAASSPTPVDDALIIANLLMPLTAHKRNADESAADAVLEDMIRTARLPRRIADRCKQLIWAQGVLQGAKRRRKSHASFRGHPIFHDALAFAKLGAEATGEGMEIFERWESGETVFPPRKHPGEEGEAAVPKKRKRRRGRRRGGGGAAESTPERPPEE